MTPNVPLLRKAVEWVEEQEQLDWEDENRVWWQKTYVVAKAVLTSVRNGTVGQLSQQAIDCQTVYCVAGKICVDLYGVDVVRRMEPHQISNTARRELGIGYDQANELFYGSNNAEDIRELCEQFAGQHL